MGFYLVEYTVILQESCRRIVGLVYELSELLIINEKKGLICLIKDKMLLCS